MTVKDINRYKKRSWLYPNTQSNNPKKLHSENLPIPIFTSSSRVSCDDVEMLENQSKPAKINWEYSPQWIKIYRRDQLLASRLKEKYWLQPVISITSYRAREQDILAYLTKNNYFVYWNNISDFLNRMNSPAYQSEELKNKFGLFQLLFVCRTVLQKIHCCRKDWPSRINTTIRIAYFIHEPLIIDKLCICCQNLFGAPCDGGLLLVLTSYCPDQKYNKQSHTKGFSQLIFMYFCLIWKWRFLKTFNIFIQLYFQYKWITLSHKLGSIPQIWSFFPVQKTRISKKWFLNPTPQSQSSLV